MLVSQCLRASVVPLAMLCSPMAAAQGSPWLPEPSTGSVSFSYVHQNADEFWHCDPAAPSCPQGGTTKTSTPGGGEDLRQNTLWLNASYALSDSVALDAQLGWAKTAFTGPGPKRMGADNLNGVTDFNVGLRWRVADELVDDWPSVALRVGAIVAGNYETGWINSVGDGGDGVEGSIIVGKFLVNRLALSGELGYRARNNDIPSEMFFNLGGTVAINDAITLGMEYRRVNAEDSLQIGGPGFAPPRFPEVEEDVSLLAGRAFWQLTDETNASMFFGRTLDGRNTAASNIIGVSLTYSFSRP